MAIDLLQVIGDDSATKEGGFAGAVFMTYTLNLNFYEQIVAPALDRAGSANVLIIADPDGYAGALEMGAQTITGVGRHYVCAPLPRIGRGVQHVKLLLMAGENYGRMLIGSGNLTLHGYGRNLELYSHYDFDAKDPGIVERYAFVRVWQFLARLEREGLLSSVACGQLDIIRRKAEWLTSDATQPADFRIWHNYDTPIWDQLQRWRRERGLEAEAFRSLWVISPYYDRDVSTLHQVTDALASPDVRVHLGIFSTNLEGRTLQARWAGRTARLGVYDVNAPDRHRPLHAKALIGIEQDSAWCLSGSANLTRPGLIKSWLGGGNLELATFQWHPDSAAFDYLLQEASIQLREIDPGQIIPVDQEPSERSTHADAQFVLTELSTTRNTLMGKASSVPPDCPANGRIGFLRSGLELCVAVDPSGAFAVSLPHPVDGADAVQLALGTHATPYRWIDHPEALARFGERAYHTRVRAKLESFDGAGKLFKELLDFLWNRVEPAKIVEEDGSHGAKGRRTQRQSGQPADEDGPPPPPAEAFVTDEELLDIIDWHVSRQLPYDRSTWSLRDLLSLVLLRLTTPTVEPDILTNSGQVDDEAAQQRTEEQELERIGTLENLRNYVMWYCRRYGRRLANPAFVRQVGAQLLFTNHFVLGRVLIELLDKVELFTNEDLRTCFWWVWAPLVWPNIVGFDGEPALPVLRKDSASMELVRTWRQSGLASLTALVMIRALGQPPTWQEGLRLPELAQMFMATRELIDRIRQQLGKGALRFDREEVREAEGIRDILDLSNPRDHISSKQIRDAERRFNALAGYLPPAERRFLPLILLCKLDLDGRGQSPQAKQLIAMSPRAGLERELAEYRRRQVPVVPAVEVSDDYVCPQCHLQLTLSKQRELLGGELVLCSSSQDALIYYRPKLPKRVV